MSSVLSPETLRSVREAAGLTLEQAAYRAGCSVRTLSRAELSESTPRADLIGRLADLYAVPIGALFVHTVEATGTSQQCEEVSHTHKTPAPQTTVARGS